jgi:hypothetical protein
MAFWGLGLERMSWSPVIVWASKIGLGIGLKAFQKNGLSGRFYYKSGYYRGLIGRAGLKQS